MKGLLTYRPEALARYISLPQGRLEKLEGLEQLRFLENGMTVQVVEVDTRGHEFWEVNNPEDIVIVERYQSYCPTRIQIIRYRQAA